MKIWLVWGVLILTAALASAVLLFIASMRYAMAPVDPPRPSPDYGMQTLISCIGVAAVIIACVTSATLISRREQDRGRPTVLGSVIVLLLAAIAALCALTIPVR